MYDAVLFPTDGSEAADAAFEHATSIAETYGAELHVLYVVDTTYAGVGAAGSNTIGSLREKGETVVSEVETRAESEGIPVLTEIRSGHPYGEIIEYSEDGIDLIIMGTQGRGGLDRVLLGSVTEKVVRTASVPVFTVRKPETDG